MDELLQDFKVGQEGRLYDGLPQLQVERAVRQDKRRMTVKTLQNLS